MSEYVRGHLIRAGLLATCLLLSMVSPAQEKRVRAAIDPQPQSTREFRSSAGNPGYSILTINNITTWHRADGYSNHSPLADAGAYFPRGTAGVLYQDGVVWGAEVYTNASFTGDTIRGQRVRVGGGTYSVGTRAGNALYGAIDPALVVIDKVFRVRRDYARMSDDDVRADAAAYYEKADPAEVTQEEMDAIRAQYELDWTEWPVSQGAPFIDRNLNGVYDPPPAFSATMTPESLVTQGHDEPGIGSFDSPADQVLWMVYNDLDVGTTQSFAGSLPIGLEVQKTVWGYDRMGALGDAYFVRYRIINKGGVDTSNVSGDQIGAFWLRNLYVAQWADPDIGGFSDDHKGCDTLLNLGYMYNAGLSDRSFAAFAIAPPAVGYDILAGPAVPSPGDSAVRALSWVDGYTNRRMSSFTQFSAGDPYSEPPYGAGEYQRGSGRWWKMLRGFVPLGDFTTSDTYYNYPPESGPSFFPYSGDPISRSGWIDGLGTAYSFPPGDGRIIVTTGPVDMAPGDTQEVYVAFVAGLGADNLSSVSVMKSNSRIVQSFFDGLLVNPPRVVATHTLEHPDAHTTKLSIRLSFPDAIVPQGVVLNVEAEHGTEQPFSVDLFDDGGHGDDGAVDGVWGGSASVANRSYPYRGTLVVQMSSGTQEYADLYAGLNLRPKPVLENWQLIWEDGQQDAAVNNGETVVFRFDIRNPDSLNALRKVDILNTASSMSGFGSQVSVMDTIPPGGTRSSEEQVLSVSAGTGLYAYLTYGMTFHGNRASIVDSFEVVSWTPPPTWRDTIPTTAVRGADWVTAVVADPALIKGHDYAITYKSSGTTDGGLLWSVTDLATNEVVLTDAPVWPGDQVWPHPVIDGIQFIVSGVRRGIADIRVVSNAGGPIAGGDPGALGSRGFPTIGSGDPTSAQQVGPARWAVHTGADSSSSGGGVRIGVEHFTERSLRGSTPYFLVPYDWEMRFTASGGWSVLAYQGIRPMQVPFELWNIGIGTPDDPSDDYRVIPWVFDADTNDVFGLNNADHPASPDDNDPSTDLVYWIIPPSHSGSSLPPPSPTYGYDAFVASINTTTQPPTMSGFDYNGFEALARMTLINLDGNNAPLPDASFPAGLNQTLPETGTIFRFVTTKPNVPGDSTVVHGSVVTGVAQDDTPLTYGLEQNYPNPFNPATNIGYRMKDRGFVKVSVFDVLGREVARLVDEEKPAGIFTATWNASAFASGVYFYRLEVKGEAGVRFVRTLKMALVK